MLPRIVSGLAENTNSILCDGPRARYSEWMSGSATAGTIAERHTCELLVPRHRYCALLKKRASGDVCFLLTTTYMDVGHSKGASELLPPPHQLALYCSLAAPDVARP